MHSHSNIPALVPLHGNGERKPRPLDRDATTIGRARGCDLALEASEVSTVHCIVFRTEDGYHVRDCKSRTGTRVNGDSIRGTPLLRDGDILHVGPFSFELTIPVGFVDAAPASPVEAQRLRESRRRLADHALRLRRTVREHVRGPVTARETELDQEISRLRAKSRTCDVRLADLEAADKELEAEREALRKHVQEVEITLARRLEEAEQQVRGQWQEFQQRCRDEESRLRAELQQESERMKQQLQPPQVEALASLEKQRTALSHQEAALKAQRAEVARMIAELRHLQEELRRPHRAELDMLAAENERLRQSVAEFAGRVTEPGASSQELDDARAELDLLREALGERDRQLAEFHDLLATAPAGEASEPELEPLRAENDLLKQLLAEKDTLVAELEAKAAPRPAKSANELERYEGELNAFHQQLEADRAKLLKEIEQLQVRNQELDDATREMEMEMSRERAELGRERIRMERMRDELKTDMEKMQREMSVRESLAPVQRLREEMKKPATPTNGDRLRSLRTNVDTPRG
jgi:pSer/pThr/pTyr-binding forkhead associated (FHA) protein